MKVEMAVLGSQSLIVRNYGLCGRKASLYLNKKTLFVYNRSSVYYLLLLKNGVYTEHLRMFCVV